MFLLIIMDNIIEDLTDTFVKELKKEENIDKIKVHVVDPLVEYTYKKLYPYILITSVIFLLIFILAIVILFLIIKNN